MEDKINQKLLDQLSLKLTDSIKEVIAQVLEKEVSNALSRALLESEFYKNLSEELRDGLKQIYTNIEETKHIENDLTQEDAQNLFNETSDQLDAILRTTEKASTEIMEIVEKHLDKLPKMQEMCDKIKNGQGCKEYAAVISSWLNTLNQDLLDVITSLSFQDLTGQRIKKIIQTLSKIEEEVFKLYVASGLSMKVKEKNPDKDFEEIKQETEAKISELKGPQEKVKQEDVDALLAELGL